jgi:acyl-CoA synthetase (AMP-forming)/AMP-acid ligase II
MKPTSESSIQETLAGLVERVTFHNAENGFCVLRAKARGHRDLVTVVGHAAIISAGEWITASGEWTNDRAHGQQFKARFLKTSAPTSVDGIEKYLGSGMIRGIGPHDGEAVGEIVVRTPWLTTGYLNNPEASEVARRSSPSRTSSGANGRWRWSCLNPTTSERSARTTSGSTSPPLSSGASSARSRSPRMSNSPTIFR